MNDNYLKYKKNNLPTPHWCDEHQILEYIHFDNQQLTNDSNNEEPKLEINSTLTEALSHIVNHNFYYSFTAKYIQTQKVNGKWVDKIIVGHMHTHSFDEVVRFLYNAPESFRISKDEEEFYSKQELEYLKLVQKYLLLIGIKDFKSDKIPSTRYRNKLHSKYCNALISRFNDKIIEEIINEKREYLVTKWYPDYSTKEYSSGESQLLITDKDYNFKLFIEFTKSEVKKYQDIKSICKEDLSNDDNIIIDYFKIIEIFK